MPYKLGSLPSEQATQAEIADYLEVQCLLSGDGFYSIVEAVEDSGLVEDEDSVDSSEVDVYNGYADALLQIDIRNQYNGDRYPFEGGKKNIALKEGVSEYYKTIYTFLLLATRWKMDADRIVGNIDGTLLFERLCKEVLLNYFGPKSKGLVFGTGSEDKGGFKLKVENMLHSFSEKGYFFRSPDGDRHHQKDGKIDLVAFIPFNDSRKGHFIAFGQCKTATTWRDKLGQLNPNNFCRLYIQPPLSFIPICIYMVCEACEDEWEELSVKSSGILFDRTRIMANLPDKMDPAIYNDIVTWVTGIKQKFVST